MKKISLKTLLVGLLLLSMSSAPALANPNLFIPPLLRQNHAYNPNAITAAQGANDFAFALTTALLENVEDENFVVSPYSLWLPVAALMNATHETHRPALMEAIGAVGLQPADLNHAVSRMLFDLTNEGNRRAELGFLEDNPLHIANAVFVDSRHTLNPGFVSVFADFFQGEAQNVDFAAPDTVEIINQWAYDNTYGQIGSIVSELCPNTVAAIINAIYFSDNWIDPFRRQNTRRDVFHAPGGEVYAYFMRREWDYTRYFEDAYMQSVTLGFPTGGGMTIMLPKDGDAVGLLSGMTRTQFDDIFTNAVSARGSLLLPRFSIESTLCDLQAALETLGLSPLFDRGVAPLTGLITHPAPCYISKITQRAMIKVDEEGATAAAVTAMLSAPIVGPPRPETVTTFEMVCDRPFAFVLHRRTQDGGRQVLFTGVVNQP